VWNRAESVDRGMRNATGVDDVDHEAYEGCLVILVGTWSQASRSSVWLLRPDSRGLKVGLKSSNHTDFKYDFELIYYNDVCFMMRCQWAPVRNRGFERVRNTAEDIDRNIRNGTGVDDVNYQAQDIYPGSSARGCLEGVRASYGLPRPDCWRLGVGPRASRTNHFAHTFGLVCGRRVGASKRGQLTLVKRRPFGRAWRHPPR
jgi:hypothetical protein